MNGPFISERRWNEVSFASNNNGTFSVSLNDSFLSKGDILNHFYSKSILNTFKKDSYVLSVLYRNISFSMRVYSDFFSNSKVSQIIKKFYIYFFFFLKGSAFDKSSFTSNFLRSFYLDNKIVLHKFTESSISNDFSLIFLRTIVYVNYYFKKFVGNIYSHFFKEIYLFVLDLVLSTFCSGNLKRSLSYFPYFFSLFAFILFFNCIGLVPYSSTFTSYVCVTLFLTFIVLIGAYVIVFSYHGLKFFGLFCPQGCPFGLIFFLIPIEFISYVFRMVSLSARLFANMMAGHALLAVLTGFSWVMFNNSDILVSVFGLLPMFVVFLLFFLETGIAIVQAIVFTILSCMYIDESINLSH